MRSAVVYVRELVHRTRHHVAIGEPAELYRVLSDLAAVIGMLPQLCEQLREWLWIDYEGGTIRGDNAADPAQSVKYASQSVKYASHDLDLAAKYAGALARMVDSAQQRAAQCRLGRSRTVVSDEQLAVLVDRRPRPA